MLCLGQILCSCSPWPVTISNSSNLNKTERINVISCPVLVITRFGIPWFIFLSQDRCYYFATTCEYLQIIIQNSYSKPNRRSWKRMGIYRRQMTSHPARWTIVKANCAGSNLLLGLWRMADSCETTIRFLHVQFSHWISILFVQILEMFGVSHLFFVFLFNTYKGSHFISVVFKK